jgi:hypothetical protein
MNRPWIRTTVVLVIFAVTFLALVVGCYRLESATMDETVHLVAGYTALRFHDYRIDPEHPPFLRMWAALPLTMDPAVRFATTNPYWLAGNSYWLAHQFLYQENDADRLLFRARFMIALLGVLLGLLVFFWARELFGFWPATIVLALYGTEPNLVAHSGLVTTDLGAACFIFGTIYFAWRLARKFGPGNLVGLTVFFVLAHISKYSALLLGPIVLALLLIRAVSAEPWPWHIRSVNLLTARRARILLVVVVVGALLGLSYGAFWGIYAFRYLPTPAGVFGMRAGAENHPWLMRFVEWVEQHHTLPNATVEGFAAVFAKRRPSYFCGAVSFQGWWSYFPVAFLIKTPLALLLMALGGVGLCLVRWKTVCRDAIYVIGPAVIYFGAAVASRVNIGLRHILMIYPFMILLAGWTIAALLASSSARARWRRVVLVVLCAGQLAEFVAIYPHCLAFFNVAIGGPSHGAEYLVDSNLDWGQGLILLKRWMTEHHVRHINLSYLGHADPAYYGIEYTPLPYGPFFDYERVTLPRLPGYVAVSATNLRCCYSGGPSLYEPLQRQKPVAILGYSLYVYWAEKPWW